MELVQDTKFDPSIRALDQQGRESEVGSSVSPGNGQGRRRPRRRRVPAGGGVHRQGQEQPERPQVRHGVARPQGPDHRARPRPHQGLLRWRGGCGRVQAAVGPADEGPVPPVPLLLHAERYSLQGRGAGRPRCVQGDRRVRCARGHREARRRRHRQGRLPQIQGGDLKQHLQDGAGLQHGVRRLQRRQGDVGAARHPLGAGRLAAPHNDPRPQARPRAHAEMDADASSSHDET